MVVEETENVEMKRFTNKGQGARRGPRGDSNSEPYLIIKKSREHFQLRFNKAAWDSFPLTQYADYYVSEDERLVGIKPVTGGDVTGNSYKLSVNRSISFAALKSQLGLEVHEEVDAVPCRWDDGSEMIIIEVGAFENPESE